MAGGIAVGPTVLVADGVAVDGTGVFEGVDVKTWDGWSKGVPVVFGVQATKLNSKATVKTNG